MKNEIANDIANYLEKHGTEVNDIYFNNICTDVSNHFDMSWLPPIAYTKYIDVSKSGSRLQKMMNDVYRYINTNTNVSVCISDGTNNVFTASSLIGRYIGDSIIKQTRIHKVLYIDTPLMLADYKKLMDYNSNTTMPPVLFHPIEVLNKEVYWYDYVIWDRFNCINSSYDLSKLQEIIHHRYLNMCGNLYIGNGNSFDECFNGVDRDLVTSMNIGCSLNLIREKFSYIKTEIIYEEGAVN